MEISEMIMIMIIIFTVTAALVLFPAALHFIIKYYYKIFKRGKGNDLA